MNRLGTLQDFRPEGVAVGILFEFQTFFYMHRCASTVRRQEHNFSQQIYIDYSDSWHTLQFTVRFSMLLEFLAIWLTGENPGTAAGTARIIEYRQRITRSLDSAGYKLMDHAYRTLLFHCANGRRIADIKERLASEVGTKGAHGTTIVIETKKFCSMARQMCIKHPDIDLLQEMCDAGPERRADVLRRGNPGIGITDGTE